MLLDHKFALFTKCDPAMYVDRSCHFTTCQSVKVILTKDITYLLFLVHVSSSCFTKQGQINHDFSHSQRMVPFKTYFDPGRRFT